MKLEFEQVGDIWKSFSSQHIVDCIFFNYKIEKVGNKYLAKLTLPTDKSGGFSFQHPMLCCAKTY